MTKNRCEELGVDRLDALDNLLTPDVIGKLMPAYDETSDIYVPGYSQYVAFQYAPLALAKGVEAAVDAIKTHALRDSREIDQQYRREALSGLPDTFAEFMDLFESHDDDDPESRIVGYAHAFGATTECSACGKSRIDEYDFAAEVQRHYRQRNRENAIVEAVWQSGIETVDGAMCADCSYRFYKD